MAVFVAATDEASGSNHLDTFRRSGFIAPLEEWSDNFGPAWQERVLNGPPPIPYLHMTDIRSRKFRESHGLTEDDAERRVDHAIQIIQDTKSLFLLESKIDTAFLRDVFSDITIQGSTEGGQVRAYVMNPDYLCFIGFAYITLDYVNKCRPECEKVDFIVERRPPITDRIRDFYDGMPQKLASMGKPELIPLLGELIPGGKDRVPLQAADLLCWHTQRGDKNNLTGVDLERYVTLARRVGHRHTWEQKEILRIAGKG